MNPKNHHDNCWGSVANSNNWPALVHFCMKVVLLGSKSPNNYLKIELGYYGFIVSKKNNSSNNKILMTRNFEDLVYERFCIIFRMMIL
jgi:hypothetical protein